MATLPINPSGSFTLAKVGATPGTGSMVSTIIPGGAGINSAQAASQNPFVPAGATSTAMPASGGNVPVGNNPGTGSGIPSSTAIGSSGVTSISSGLSTQDGSYTLVGDFSDTYGKGTGTALADTLGSLGTATNGAVSATNAAIEADAAKQMANIQSSEAASGVTANSSTAALAAGDFSAGVNQNIASTDAGMELSEENTLISALQNEGQSHGPDGSTLDSVLGGIGDAASVAGLFF